MIDPILMCKTRCNGDKYFSIFENHLPDLKPGSDICMYDISNELCIMHIIDRYPNCNYYISDIPEIITSFKILRPELKLNLVEDKTKRFDITMKFDCIIMNPPYQKNLHLKILAEAIKHLKDDDSVCVNLSPVRWLQDPFALYKCSELKKFESTICKKIDSLNVINNELVGKLFNIAIYSDLGIYTCKSNNTTFNYKNCWKDTKNNTEINVIEKCCLSFKTKTLENKRCLESPAGVCVPIADIAGGRGTLPIFKNYPLIIDNMINNENWIDVWNRDPKHKAFQKQKDSNIYHIKFNTICEAENFYKSYKTIFLQYVCNITVQQQHIQLKFLPWLGDAINPRTGLKGYEGEWTDEDLYKFFNITEDERKIIEETMARYK